MSLSDPHQPFALPSQMSPRPDVPEDATPFCPTCFRDNDECPGHDEDRRLLDLGAQLVTELRRMHHPVPKSIVRTINAIEDHIRLTNPDFLNERF